MEKLKVTKKVVAAIIMYDGKVFAAQRSESDVRYLKYEFPGGKVESGESNEEALKRELWEELHMEISDLQFFTNIIHDYDVFILDMDVYICRVSNNSFTLTVHAGAGFFTKEALEGLPFLGADKIVLKRLLQHYSFK